MEVMVIPDSVIIHNVVPQFQSDEAYEQRKKEISLLLYRVFSKYE